MRTKYLFPIVFLFFFSCKKISNDLEGVTIFNGLDKDSGIEIFVFDKITVYRKSIKFEYHLRWEIIKDSAQIFRTQIYRDNKKFKVTNPGVYDVIYDLNVFPNTTYEYKFALEDTTGNLSKFTTPMVITTPP
jgi:hypothetical protein